MQRNKASRSGWAPGSSRGWENRCVASEDAREAPVALQVAPARLRAFPSQIKTNSEALEMTTHALPAEARTKAGGGGAPGRGRARCRKTVKGREGWAVSSFLWHLETNNTTEGALSEQTRHFPMLSPLTFAVTLGCRL